jgi:transposase
MSKAMLTKKERRLMREKLRCTSDAREHRRLLGILDSDQGVPIVDIAQRLNVSRQSVYNWIARFRSQKTAEDLCDAPRSGRPMCADEAFDILLQTLLMLSPQRFGYHAMRWTVRLMRDQLRKNLERDYSDDTIRRGLHRLGYAWKRLRYVLMPDPQQEKKTPNSPRRLWFAGGKGGTGGGRDRFAAVSTVARDVVEAR